MTDTTTKVREHYNATDLIDQIKAALETFTARGRSAHSESPRSTRGILATAELADAVRLSPSMGVPDLGCGIGGPARYLAENFCTCSCWCRSECAFHRCATYPTARCGLSDRLTFDVGDALLD
jgi:hypothetical protein